MAQPSRYAPEKCPPPRLASRRRRLRRSFTCAVRWTRGPTGRPCGSTAERSARSSDPDARNPHAARVPDEAGRPTDGRGLRTRRTSREGVSRAKLAGPGRNEPDLVRTMTGDRRFREPHFPRLPKALNDETAVLERQGTRTVLLAREYQLHGKRTIFAISCRGRRVTLLVGAIQAVRAL